MQHKLRQIKAQHFYTDLGLYQQCKLLQNIVEFKDFSRLLSDFPRQILISRTFQESTFQACANPANLGVNNNGPDQTVWMKYCIFRNFHEGFIFTNAMFLRK